MTENKRRMGECFENIAKQYITEIGYKVIYSNFFCKAGEIDIVALYEDMLVFIEVKYRSTDRYGLPEEAVDYRKQQKIRKSALYFMTKYNYSENTRVRFDVIAILDKQIKHIKDAF